jgi:hypothetical protein
MGDNNAIEKQQKEINEKVQDGSSDTTSDSYNSEGHKLPGDSLLLKIVLTIVGIIVIVKLISFIVTSNYTTYMPSKDFEPGMEDLKHPYSADTR